ncbi:MAG: hypothetical protein RMY29_008535 [Nostoc sp. CreGUA01]|nr:hypothetical protein [Nostoc sp. CreGUA01]
MGHGAGKEDGEIRGWGDGGKEELLSPSFGHLPISPPPYLPIPLIPLIPLISLISLIPLISPLPTPYVFGINLPQG